MKILFDQNISHRIIAKIVAVYRESTHVKSENLINSPDYEIFMYARQNNYEIVISRDDDFAKLVEKLAVPPKVICMRTGNASTEQLAKLLIHKKTEIEEFLKDENSSCLNIFI